MATFLLFWRHAAADSPAHNEKSRKSMAEYMSKAAELNAKHGVKWVGSWVVLSEHLAVDVGEAPSFEAMQALLMEPEIMSLMNWTTMELKAAMTLEETWKMMQAQ
ncbi:MAG: hypothetical protein ABSD89_11535 [Halobacteriota archaeon]|jgi:hypothetical protein